MELGSEYSLALANLEIEDNNIYKYLSEYRAEYYDTGRNALKSLIAMLDISEGTILVPEYICESVIKCFPIHRIVFYKIKEDFMIDEDDVVQKMNEKVSIFFLMNYFGTLQPESTRDIIKRYSKDYSFTIIEDTTHSIFTRRDTIGDYMIASLRKWLPVPGLGVMYSQNVESFNLLKDNSGERRRSNDNEKIIAMMLKDMYINHGLDCNEKYRRIFADCERRIDSEDEIRLASNMSIFLAKCFDVNDIIEKRAKNYNYLCGRLKNTSYEPVNYCDTNESIVPFNYIIRLSDKKKRDELRQYLIQNKIFCAVHWPDDGIRQAERAAHVENADTLLSLPIDQRYGTDGMDYLADTILSF